MTSINSVNANRDNPRLTSPLSKRLSTIRDQSSNSQRDSAPRTHPPAKQNAKEVDLIYLKEKPVLTKTIKDGSVSYKYTGPKNENIKDFLEDLYAREGSVKPTGPLRPLLEANSKIDTFFKRHFPHNCTDGPLAINKDTILLFLIMMIGMIYYSVKVETAAKSAPVGLAEFITKYGAVYVIIFTFFGLIYLSLPATWAFLVFVIQIIVPLFLILFDADVIIYRKNAAPVNQESLVVRIAVMFLTVFWGCVYPPYKLLKRLVGRFISHIFVGAVFIGVFVLAIGLPALNLMNGKSKIDLEFFKEHATTFIFLFAIFISFSWIVIHFKFFWVPSYVLENTLMEIAKKLEKKENKPQRPGQTDFVEVRSFKNRIMKNIYWIASLIIGSTYIIIEMYLLSKMLETLKTDDVAGFTTTLFFSSVIPIFLIVGVPIGLANIHARNKTLFLPIIVMIPMFGLVPLSQTLQKYTGDDSLTLFIVAGPPLMIFFWLAMAFLGLKRRRVFYFIFMFSCLFFFLPFVFLGMSKSTYFKSGKTALFWIFVVLVGFFFITAVAFATKKLFFTISSYIKQRVEASRKRRMQQKQEREVLEKYKRERKERRMKQKKEQMEAQMKADGIVEEINLEDDEEEDEDDIAIDEMATDLENVKKRKKNPNEEKNQNLNLLKEVETRRRIRLLRILYLNLKNFGFWINAAAFIISYTFVAYTYFNMPSSTGDSERGTLLGITIVMPIIFITNNLLIRMKTAKIPKEERNIYAQKSEFEKPFFESNIKRDEQRLESATAIESLVLVFGIFLIPLAQTPLFFSLDRSGRVVNLFIMLTSILFSIFVGVIIEVKKRSGTFHKFFIPAFVSLCWIFALLPFVVLIPLVSAILRHNTPGFETFVKGSLTGSAFLIMFGVTLFAIIVNIFFQKLEREKLIKFVIKTLQRILKENAVKADNVVVRRLIEDFLKRDTEEEIENMRKGLIEDRIPIVPYKSFALHMIHSNRIYPPIFRITPYYSAGLILIETYNKIAQAQDERRRKGDHGLKAEKPNSTLFQKLANCCSEKDNDDSINGDNYDEDRIKELAINIDDSFFKADFYLPPDFDKNIWNYALGNAEPNPDFKSNRDVLDNTLNPSIEHGYPLLKPSEIDCKMKDHMTPVLEAIPLKSLTPGDMKNLNNYDHTLMIQSDMALAEIWYQHIYDYFAGRTFPYSKDNDSSGLIHKNFGEFLRVTGLNQEKEFNEKSIDSIYTSNAQTAAKKGTCLNYNEFIQALVEVADQLLTNTKDEKLLKRFTKKIYPAIMLRIPDIAKNYTKVQISFKKTKTPYTPCLDLFDKRTLTKTQNNITSSSPDKRHAPSLFSNDERDINMDTSQLSFKTALSPLRRRETLRPSKLQILTSQNNMNQYDKGRVSSINIQRRYSSEIPSPALLSPNVSSPVLSSPSISIAKSAQKAKKVSAKGRCRSCLLKIHSLWVSFSRKIAGCFYVTFVKGPRAAGDWVFKKTKRVGKSLGFAIDDESDEENENAAIRKVARQAPVWEDLVNLILITIPKAENLYFQRMIEKGVQMQFNLTNIIAILGKINEVYVFTSFGFRPQIPWFSSNEKLSTARGIMVRITGMSIFDSFYLLFWLAFGLVCVYLLISIPAIRYLRKGKLGEDELGRKAKFPHPQFFLTFTITILGNSLFTQTMRYLLNAFVCNYSTSPWKLMNNEDIVCLSGKHFFYMGMASLALLIYYPISTFMFPNFQFQNKVLDLKYDPSYIVVLIQFRLIITGFMSFFKPTDASDKATIMAQLLGVFTVLVLMALACLILKPCLIKKANVWDVGGYSLAAWGNLCGLVVLLTKNSIAGIIMLASGWVIIIGATIFVIKKYYSVKSKKKKKMLKTVATVKYDANKRNAVIVENNLKNPAETKDKYRKRDNQINEYYKGKKGYVF